MEDNNESLAVKIVYHRYESNSEMSEIYSQMRKDGLFPEGVITYWDCRKQIGSAIFVFDEEKQKPTSSDLVRIVEKSTIKGDLISIEIANEEKELDFGVD